MTTNWYVIHTYSGHENKVKTHLEKLIEAEGMEEKITQVLVPTEEVVEMKQGKKTSSTKKLFPSYVLVEMEMDRAAWHLVTNAPGVTHFVGSGTKPQPFTGTEQISMFPECVGARTIRGRKINPAAD